MSYSFTGTVGLFLFLGVIALPALIVLCLFAIASSRYRKHLFKSGQSVVAEYAAPDNLTPAEIGYLFHFRSDVTDIFGTAFDLERRGYLTLERLPDSVLITVKNPDPTGLKNHEVQLISLYRKPAQLTRGYAHELRFSFSQTLRMELEQSGYLKGSVTGHYLIATLAAIVLMNLVFPGILLLASPTLETLGAVVFFIFVLSIFFYGPVGLLLAWLYTVLAGHAWMGSAKMKSLWPEILGFRSYIQLAEIGQIKYNSDDLRLSCTNYAFPYAVALGFNTNWQKPKA